MSKQFVGTYKTVEQALEVVERLRSKGYAKSHILLVANKEVQESIPEKYEKDIDSFEDKIDHTDEAKEDGSFWENIRHAFSIREPKKQSDRTIEDLLYNHQEAIDSGEIAIIVDELPQGHNGEKLDRGPAYGDDKINISGVTGRGINQINYKDN